METLLSKHWHAIASEDVHRFLETDMEKGLDHLEVRRRQEHFGPNIITGKKKTNPLILFLQQFNQALVYILIGAGAITFILQEYVEAVFIFVVVLVNAAIGFVQEYKALTSIEALAQTMETEAKTIRAGRCATTAVWCKKARNGRSMGIPPRAPWWWRRPRRVSM